MAGRDLSAELFDVGNGSGQDLSSVLFPQETPSALNRVQALAAGFNRGAIPGVIGLPVDTAQNVIDLIKAGAGYAASKLNNGQVPEWLHVNPDRSEIAGSSEWLAKKARDVGAGVLFDNPNPQDSTSRAIYAAGAGMGGALATRRLPIGETSISTPKQVIGGNSAAALGGASAGGASQSVMDQTNDPSLAVLASFAPSVIAPTAAAATRGMVRGASGAQMQDNLNIAKRSGVDLSVGQASQGAIPLMLESMLSKMPGAYGVFRSKGAQQQEGLANKVAELTAGSPNEPDVSGRIIQNGIAKFFKPQFLGTADSLYSNIGNKATGVYPVTNALTQLGLLSDGIPGAPATSQWLGSGSLNGLKSALASDAAPKVSVIPAPAGLPWDAIKGTRTAIGDQAFDNRLIGTPESGKLKSVYGALSQDMENAANTAGASGDYSRANKYWEAGMQRVDKLQPFANAATPERAFEMLVNSGNHGPSTINALKRSIPSDQWKQVVSNIVDDLGTAKPGQQNSEGNAFSSETFLTNWNKMDPKAKSALISGFDGATDARSKLDDMARTASLMRSSSKVLANPSGTGQVMIGSGLASGIGGALMTGHPLLAAGVASIPLLGYGGANLLTSPGFANWLAKPTAITPRNSMDYAGRSIGLLQSQQE